MVIQQILRPEVFFGDEQRPGWLPPGAATPNPTPVEVVELDLRIEKYDDDPGYFLIWEDESGKHVGDTWHQSFDEAVESRMLLPDKAVEWVAP